MINKIKEKYNPSAIFPYGSSVYQNKIPEDYDFIIVTDNSYFQEAFEDNGIKFEITNYSKEEFINKLKDHEISILECIFIKHKNFYISDTIKDVIINFSLEKEKLRESCSQKSSNSYVKAKKKLIIDEDYNVNVSLKSLWHSFRILDFAKQLATNSEIDPLSVNNLYDEIVKDYLMYRNDWDKLHEKYKPLHNKVASEFKLICPKNNNHLKFK